MQALFSSELTEIAKQQSDSEAELLNLPNVVGVGIGAKYKNGVDTGENAIVVMVNHKLPTSLLPQSALVQPEYNGFRTDVIDVGEIFAQPLDAPGVQPVTDVERGAVVPKPAALQSAEPQVLKRRIRPAMGGFSVAHTAVTAGTIATGCYDEAAFPGIPGKYYILSNNHVLANSNNATPGDPIVQPGPIDGGTMPADFIGRLARFIPIRFQSGTDFPLNYVDAAIAEVPFEDISREIYWIGYANRRIPTAIVNVGDLVQKCGRTTNFTTGKVTAVNATIDVNYGGGRVARFAKQIVTTGMSAGGDSGSLVLDLDERAVGLLFAGSTTTTILNPIELVQALLKVRLTELP